jgi:hypothetical protein
VDLSQEFAHMPRSTESRASSSRRDDRSDADITDASGEDPDAARDPTSRRKEYLPAVVPAPREPHHDAASRVAQALLDFVSEVPPSDRDTSRAPAEAARKLATEAAAKAATAAGTLALPPGPLGWLTILPEMLTVWRIQARLVADIAAVHGRSATLTREQMIWCLFRHTASQAVRDLVVRVGERFIVKPVAFSALQSIARRIGVHLTERTLAKGASRWLPVVGALGVAAYAYYDTAQVAKAAIELFERPIELESPPEA